MAKKTSAVEGEGKVEVELVVGNGRQTEASFGDILKMGAGVGDVLDGWHDGWPGARCGPARKL